MAQVLRLVQADQTPVQAAEITNITNKCFCFEPRPQTCSMVRQKASTTVPEFHVHSGSAMGAQTCAHPAPTCVGTITLALHEVLKL